MKQLLKRQGVGTWISLGTILLAVVALCIYGAALDAGDGVQPEGGAPVFLVKSTFGSITATGVAALLLIPISIVLGQFKFDGILGTIYNVVVGAVRILIPALFTLMLVKFLGATLEGIGWTFFSNPELQINPQAVTTGILVIVAIIFLLLAAITAIVAAFFKLTKEGIDFFSLFRKNTESEPAEENKEETEGQEKTEEQNV